MSAPILSSDGDIPLRSLSRSVFAPTLLFGIGQGAVIPVIALAALDRGASFAVAGLIVALRGIGTMIFDVPAGALVARLGERRALACASAAVVTILLAAIHAPSVVAFAACVLLLGCAWSVWLLARLSYVTEIVPIHQRGRALATIGGMTRIGHFVGPFIGAAAIAGLGLSAAFVVHIVATCLACALLLAATRSADEPHAAAGHHLPVAETLRRHRATFLSAGVVAMSAGMLRSSRQAILPLWATMIGLGPAVAAVIFGLSAAIDMTLWYPAGLVTDRWGRRVTAAPCLAILAAGHLALPFTASAWSLTLVGLVLGLGNGLGSGIVMTLGADFAPSTGRAEFLGAFRLVSDIGVAAGPGIVAAIAGVATLGAAAASIGVIGLAATVFTIRRLPETLGRRPSPAPGTGTGAPGA